MNWAFAALLLLALNASGQVRTFALGGVEHDWAGGGDGIDPEFLFGSEVRPQVDTSNVVVGAVEFVHRPGWVSARFFDGEENIASLVLKGEGSIDVPNAATRYTDLRQAQLRGIVNGDHAIAFERKPTPFNPLVPAYGIWIILDFAQQIGVQRVRFYPRNTVAATPRQPYQDDFLRAYELWVNPRLTNSVSGSPDILVIRELENEEPVVEVAVKPQYVRLVKLRSLSEVPFEIDEIEVYGTGYMDRATYQTDLIDLGTPATVGEVRWVEETVGEAPFSRLTARVRTGLDDTPIIYRQRFGADDPFALSTDAEVSAAEYWSLDRLQRLPPKEDEKNWSPWQRVLNGGLATAPGPRRFIQFQFAFEGRLFDTRLVDRLEFDYLHPPIADTLRAEVFPRLAAAEKPATFHYAVLLRANGEVHGYDALAVDSNAPVANIRNVRLDGQAVDFAVEYAHEEGFRLSFALVRRDRAVLEFTYDLPIFRFGTTFSSRAYNSRFPTVPQSVEPGPAVDFGPEDQDELSGLAVEIPKPQIGKLVGEIAVGARVFTPNGDGVNDQFEMFFNLLQLVEPAPVSLAVFNLAGRRVHRVFAEERGIGPAHYRWDGRTADGKLLTPGTYIWVLRVQADAFEERHLGTLGVAY